MAENSNLRTVVLENLNNKLAATDFVVVGKAPHPDFRYDNFPVTVLVKDEANRVDFTARITQMLQYPAIAVPEIFARLSHGKSAGDLYYYLEEKNLINDKGFVAVWLYEKCVQ